MGMADGGGATSAQRAMERAAQRAQRQAELEGAHRQVCRWYDVEYDLGMLEWGEGLFHD